MPNKIILLYSNCPSTVQQGSDQTRAKALLETKGFNFETVDGVDPEMKDRRNELFNISGIRGNYPQFFKVDGAGKTTYVGQWADIENINECDTWEETFGSLKD